MADLQDPPAPKKTWRLVLGQAGKLLLIALALVAGFLTNVLFQKTVGWNGPGTVELVSRETQSILTVVCAAGWWGLAWLARRRPSLSGLLVVAGAMTWASPIYHFGPVPVRIVMFLAAPALLWASLAVPLAPRFRATLALVSVLAISQPLETLAGGPFVTWAAPLAVVLFGMYPAAWTVVARTRAERLGAGILAIAWGVAALLVSLGDLTRFGDLPSAMGALTGLAIAVFALAALVKGPVVLRRRAAANR